MKEGKVLFNDTHNTFYGNMALNMVKDYSDREKTCYSHYMDYSPISSKGYFICTIPPHDSTHHGLFLHKL